MLEVGSFQVVDGGKEDVDEREFDVLHDGFADFDVQLLRQRDQPVAFVDAQLDIVFVVTVWK